MGTGLCQAAQRSGSDRAQHIPGSGSGLLVCLAKEVGMSSAVPWQLPLLAQDGGLGHPKLCSKGEDRQERSGEVVGWSRGCEDSGVE